MILGIIPARGGSKGIPGKNLRLLGGRPLVVRAADAARESGVVDRLILSTDSVEIADVGRAHGIDVPFMRPTELATDSAAMLPVMQHATRFMIARGDAIRAVMLLQPTAPLRSAQHLRRARGLMEDGDPTSVVSVVPVPEHFRPHVMMRVEGDRLSFLLPDASRFTSRQACPPAFLRDGTVYLTRVETLLDENSIYGPRCRPLILDPAESCNLDTPEDWTRAESMLRASGRI
jgi:CMP-N-acetylneuraminic acid synthetase